MAVVGSRYKYKYKYKLLELRFLLRRSTSFAMSLHSYTQQSYLLLFFLYPIFAISAAILDPRLNDGLAKTPPMGYVPPLSPKLPELTVLDGTPTTTIPALRMKRSYIQMLKHW